MSKSKEVIRKDGSINTSGHVRFLGKKGNKDDVQYKANYDEIDWTVPVEGEVKEVDPEDLKTDKEKYDEGYERIFGKKK